MLEREETLYNQRYETKYAEGFRIGVLTERVWMVRKVLKKEEGYQEAIFKGKEISEKHRTGHEVYEYFMSEEGTRNIIEYSKKYPRISEERLAEKIWKEGEFWY